MTKDNSTGKVKGLGFFTSGKARFDSIPPFNNSKPQSPRPEQEVFHADMLSALRAIVAVAETEDSFSMQTIKDCANIAIKQANPCIFRQAADSLTKPEQEPAAWGLERRGQIIDCITPADHDRLEGGYTIPLYRRP